MPVRVVDDGIADEVNITEDVLALYTLPKLADEPDNVGPEIAITRHVLSKPTLTLLSMYA